MYIRILRRRDAQRYTVALCAIGAVWLFLQYPDAVAAGINRGMSVCSTVIIPTLFPFMLLAGWLTDSPLCHQPGRGTQWIARHLFGLPGCCAPAILMALVGGYPAGIVAVSRLYRQGQIDAEETHRMTAFCICGGPGFIVGTVGNGLLHSIQAGWLLYAAHAGTAIAIGALLGRGHRYQDDTAPSPTIVPLRPFATMIADTCSALLGMCGLVTAATMALSLIEGIGLTRGIAALYGGSASVLSAVMGAVMEVSSGCIALAGMPQAPLWLSLCLGWGGLSVQGQLASLLPERRLLTPRFWLWRGIHGTLAAVVAAGLFYLFPPRQNTGGGIPTPLPYAASAPASGMLLILCFLTMLCFSEKKTGKTANDVV